MKLYLNKPSPYARLVMVVAHEKGIASRLELEWVDPWKNPANLLGANPFSRVPTLIADDGLAILDSACICDYLDGLGGGRPLLPVLPERVAVLRKYGQAKALTDCAFGAVIERRFNSAAGEPALAARWISAASAALDGMEGDPSVAAQSAIPDLGDLALAVGLGYIDFRLKDMEWRCNRPRLAGWFKAIAERASMKATLHE